MKQSLTLATLAGACALALAVPSVSPRLADPLTPATPAAPAASASAEPSTPAASSPSTVAETTTGGPTDDQTRGVVLITTETVTGTGAGTGMVLTASGQVLTNYHVVEGSTAIEVEVVDTGGTYAATVVGHDASRDVALLQLEDASGLATITPDDDALVVGDALTAVGNASGGGELVAAAGTVTALEQQVTVGDGSGGSETLTGVIQTSAAAVPGDSGGPMFDAEGEVAGMTTAGSQTVTRGPRGTREPQAVTTVSFAVPIDDALAVVAAVRAASETDTVRIGPRAYLGIMLAGESGLQVGSVVADGPAASAGLTADATITSLGGTPVASHDELAAVLGTLEPGQEVTLAWTDATGAAHAATVGLGASPVN